VIIALGGTTRTDQLGVPFSDIRASLHAYDQFFRLPDPKLTIVVPIGRSIAALQLGEAGETIEDIEVAHMVAPGAAITVVVAGDDRSPTRGRGSPKRESDARAADLLRAINYGVTNDLGDVISLSYAIGEGCATVSEPLAMHRVFRAARVKHITVLAGSGDEGALGVRCSFSRSDAIVRVALPAADPLVTSVGGTTLQAARGDGAYGSETAWNYWITSPTRRSSYLRLMNDATGGGMSRRFARPSYQDRVPGIGTHRGVPDVAFDADPFTGPALVARYSNHAFVGAGGGTSDGAPAWAGIVALADQYAGRRLGFLNAAIYRIGRAVVYPQAFHDVVSGSNTVRVVTPHDQSIVVHGFTAGTGWDAVTGWGTPKVAALVPLLVQYVRSGDGSRL
jgi:subtilase family serine protease